MLTKDLVQATVRNGRLFPKFIRSDDPKALSDAKSICELFADATGRVVSDLEDDVKASAGDPRGRAFSKILMDQCEVAEPGDEILDLRWRAFSISEKLRATGEISADQFRERLAAELGQSISDLQQKIFSDLPSARTIEKMEPLSPLEVIERYNLSHITTFLCFAEDVSVAVTNVSVAQKREIMRRLKFHRLMSDVDVDHDACTMRLELSGPLKIFGKTQGYALRIANFFPFIASLPEWELEAKLTWKGRKVSFVVDEKSGVKTRYGRSGGGYIPKEFQLLLDALNESGDFQLKPGDDFVHLGKQSYCFPDFIVRVGNKDVAIELFHPWHKGQAKHRIEAASRAKSKGLLIGVDRSLLKDSELKSVCDSDPWFADNGFEFSQFPTPNVLKRVINRHG